MGGLKRFQIFLDNVVCCSGQPVSGYIEVELNSPKRLRGILVKFKGEANVNWSETESTTDSNNQSTSQTVTYSARETYFNKECVLLGDRGHDLTLPVGKHTFPFSTVLPLDLPSSFEGEYGSVRYTVKAVIDRSWKFNHEAKAFFTVIRHLDLNHQQSIKEPVQYSAEKYVCCLCCRSGPLLVDVSLPFTGYVPGQEIPVSVSVDNATTESIEMLADLYQSIIFHSTTKKRTENYKILTSVLGPVSPRGSGSWTHRMQVPSVAPSYLLGCKIIDISYWIQVKARIIGAHRDLNVKVPIVIGTIPIVTYLPTSGSSAPARFIEIQPSALDMETRPPPYSPEMSPPTYEECMHGKKVIQEEDDNKYVLGDMTFAPCYPTYQFNKFP